MPRKSWQLLALAALTAATVSFHYGFLMPPGAHVLHAIHGRRAGPAAPGLAG